MAFFERVRSAFHNIGVRLRIIRETPSIPPIVKEQIRSVERETRRLERTIPSSTEVRIVDRGIPEPPPPPPFPPPPYIPQPPLDMVPPPPPDYVPELRRYVVDIQYRPVGSSRAFATRTAVVEAESKADAIAIVEEGIEHEPDWIIRSTARFTDLPLRPPSEGPPTESP